MPTVEPITPTHRAEKTTEHFEWSAEKGWVPVSRTVEVTENYDG